ncbi:MAG: oligoendopeptidase F [Phototrophicaceae bacterium]
MASTKVLDRSDVPQEQRWNDKSVFENREAWQAEFDTLADELPKLGEFKGTLSESSATLADYWELESALRRRLRVLSSYVGMSTSVDSTDGEAKAMMGQLFGLFGIYSRNTAFSTPELIAMGEDALLAWVNENERLSTYKRAINEMFRQAQYTRSSEVEQIMGMLGEPFGGTQNAYSELSNTDLQFEDAVGADGESFPVNQSSIGMVKGSPDREIRRTGWENYNKGYLQFKNTFAATYLTSVKQSTMQMRVRGYDSVLEMMLSPHNLPVEVFHNLIDTYKKNLPTWHRYWEAKRKILGVETLNEYDIWAPMTSNEPEVDYKQAVNWIAEGMKPLGEDYVNTMVKGCLEENWVDWSMNKGKRQGAFSNGAYDTHPFIMMSFDNQLGGMSTLAHELGHSMHSYYSRKTQPEYYAGYSMFAAETASNFNQAMTRAYLFEQNDDRDFQLALIQEAMDNFHRYFFIMPTLARFEYEVHERQAAGKPLTADTLLQIMSEYFAEGYGDTLKYDADITGITWATFGHLYLPYYTFQYATGISAAHALADSITEGGDKEVSNYLKFLNAGGSLDPLDALNMAGVDMLSPEPIEKTFEVLSQLVDRLESLAE